MGFSRQNFWSGLPLPSPEDLPNPGIKPRSPALQADALLSELPGGFICVISNKTLPKPSHRDVPLLSFDIFRYEILDLWTTLS